MKAIVVDLPYAQLRVGGQPAKSIDGMADIVHNLGLGG